MKRYLRYLRDVMPRQWSLDYGTPFHAIGVQVIYRECYGFERAFLPSGVFYLTLLPAFQGFPGAGCLTRELAALHVVD